MGGRRCQSAKAGASDLANPGRQSRRSARSRRARLARDPDRPKSGLRLESQPGRLRLCASRRRYPGSAPTSSICSPRCPPLALGSSLSVDAPSVSMATHGRPKTWTSGSTGRDPTRRGCSRPCVRSVRLSLRFPRPTSSTWTPSSRLCPPEPCRSPVFRARRDVLGESRHRSSGFPTSSTTSVRRAAFRTLRTSRR